jgi:hypothetical protein
MREMAIFAPSDPDSHGHNRFGSLRLPLAYAKSRHVPRSLEVVTTKQKGLSFGLADAKEFQSNCSPDHVSGTPVRFVGNGSI